MNLQFSIWVYAIIAIILGALSLYLKFSQMVKFMKGLKTMKKDPYKQPDVQTPYLKSRVPEKLDCVIIGSGMGGLVSGAILAQKQKQVLILEQHDIAGGCMHTFAEKGFTFDTGFHYIGLSKESGFSHKNLLSLALSKPIEYHHHQDYDNIKIAEDAPFTFTAGRRNHFDNLKKQFPESTQEIDTYQTLIYRGYDALQFHSLIHLLIPVALQEIFHFILNLFFQNVYFKTIQQVMDQSGISQNQKLVALIIGQLGDLGVMPNECAFIMFCGLVTHYINGSVYPKEGSMDIVKSVACTITQNGGTILVKAHVARILVENNQVVGVEMKNGDKILCRNVISSIGRLQTASILPNKDNLSVPYPQARGHIYGFFGIQGQIHYPEGNLWYWPYTKENNFDMLKLDEDFAQKMVQDQIEEFSMESSPLFIKFLNHPENKNEKISCLIITQAPDATFEKYAVNDVQRKEGYKELKDKIKAHLTKKLEEFYPQVKGQITYSDIGTSLTNQHYFQRFSSYGMRLTLNRLFDSSIYWNPATTINGLWLSGQDVTTPGVSGAISSGFITAAQFLQAF